MNNDYKSYSLLNIIISIWSNLNKRRKTQLILLLFVMGISGISELISLSAIVPFLVVLTDPNKIWENQFVSQFASLLNFSQQSEIVVPITILFAFTALFSGFIRVINLWLNTKMSAAIGNDLSYKVYKIKLLQPYIIHTQENSSEVINSIVININSVVRVVERSLALITSLIIILNIFIGLMIFDPYVTLVVSSSLILCYVLLNFLTKLKLVSNSRILTLNQQKQIKLIQESLGSIKDIFIFKAKDIYLKNYHVVDKKVRESTSKNLFLTSFPRFTIESCAIFVLTISSLLFRNEYGFNEGTLIILGVFALASQKLLPNMQQIYVGFSAIRANSQQTKNVLEVLKKKIPPEKNLSIISSLNCKKNIELINVSFRYKPENEFTIKNLSVEIHKGESVGIIGRTGSGKSTLIDILLGFLKPSEGSLKVDGKNIHDQNCPDRLIRWQNSITYVPQSIYLMDSSIKENIAYGISPSLIDFELVKECSKKAKIHDFIVSTIDGYETFCGERGIKLSGGQVQRIAIARALYKKSKIFIFDEATSALDTKTELEIINSLKTYNKNLTIIMIAHRLNTLKNCDKIIDMESGSIKKIIKGYDLDI